MIRFAIEMVGLKMAVLQSDLLYQLGLHELPKNQLTIWLFVRSSRSRISPRIKSLIGCGELGQRCARIGVWLQAVPANYSSVTGVSPLTIQ
jgi:hypothetical protein